MEESIVGRWLDLVKVSSDELKSINQGSGICQNHVLTWVVDWGIGSMALKDVIQAMKDGDITYSHILLVPKPV